MIYRRLGRTNLEVSVVGMGGGAFYNPDIGPREIDAVMSFVVSKGVNLIETAEDYDESKLKDALSQTRDAILTSKSTAYDNKTMGDAVDSSLDKLGVDYIDIYQVQTLTTVDDLHQRIDQGVLDALKTARAEKKIGYIGLSSHRLKTIIEAIKTDEFDVIELPYSIGQHASEEVLEAARDHDVGVIAIMTFAGGALVDRDGESPAAGFMTPENALSYVLSNETVSTALVGMSSVLHAWGNIRWIDEKKIALSDSERKEIEKRAFDFLGEDFCRSCKGCMPCDEHGWPFSIDNFFRFFAFYENYGYTQFAQEYKTLPILADQCTECGACEERCPYGVPIMSRLKTVHEQLKRND